MIKVVITTTLTMTPAQYESEQVQQLLSSINSGELKRELNKEKVVKKATVTYWTNAKTRGKNMSA